MDLEVPEVDSEDAEEVLITHITMMKKATAKDTEIVGLDPELGQEPNRDLDLGL